MRRALLTAALVAGLGALPGLAAEPGEVTEYQAEYQVHYKGRRVAEARFSVTVGTDSEFTFSSSTRARGLLRLVSPRPATEQSRFNTEGRSLRPVRFSYADGTRKGEDNYVVEFDRTAVEIVISSEAGSRKLPLEDDLLDRGTLQVALMRDLAACKMPGAYRYVDDDGINVTRYERLEDLAAETSIGTLTTVRFSQQREGSSRNTVLWLATEFAYLPVRIEQFRNGELETVFSLETVSGIERKTSSCSSFG